MKEIPVDDFVIEELEPELHAALHWVHNNPWREIPAPAPAPAAPQPVPMVGVDTPSPASKNEKHAQGQSIDCVDKSGASQGQGIDCVDKSGASQDQWDQTVPDTGTGYEDVKEECCEPVPVPEEREPELLGDDGDEQTYQAQGELTEEQKAGLRQWQAELENRDMVVIEQGDQQVYYEETMKKTLLEAEATVVSAKEYVAEKEKEEEGEKKAVANSLRKWSNNMEEEKKRLNVAKHDFKNYIEQNVGKFLREEISKLAHAREFKAILAETVRKLEEQAFQINVPQELGSIGKALESAPNPNLAPVALNIRQLAHVSKLMNKTLRSVTHNNMYVVTIKGKLETGGGEGGATSILSTGIGETPAEAYKNALVSAHTVYKNKTCSSRASSSVCGSTISSKYGY